MDPVKRTIVRVPKVVQRRGRLRWIGDLVGEREEEVKTPFKYPFAPPKKDEESGGGKEANMTPNPNGISPTSIPFRISGL